MNTTVLIVEDDESILHLIDVSLTMDYYKVIKAQQGKEVDFRIRTEHPNLILLDLGLPDMDGLDVIHNIRKESDIPIIVISARHEEHIIVEALDRGANDYMTKPFSIDELRARIRVVLRMYNRNEEIEDRFENGPLYVDFNAKTVFIEGQEVRLTPNEFQLLDVLSHHVGKVLTYQTLLKALYGYVNKTEMAALRVHMASLRKKLAIDASEYNDKKLIQTHPRIGYQMMHLT